MTGAILIIDDDTIVASSLELLLKRAGYRAESVHRMSDALPAVARVKPSLVLLDMICLTGFFFFAGYYYLLSTYCCALRYCSAD